MPDAEHIRPSPSSFLRRVRAAGGRVGSELQAFVEPDLVPLAWAYADRNGPYRKEIGRLLVGSVSREDRPLVLDLMDREVAAARAGGETEQARTLLGFLLYRIGEVEDALAVWRAKTSSTDGLFAVDVQLIVGAGVSETIGFLERQGTEEAMQAALYLIECETTGDFADLDRHFEGWDDESAWG